MSDIEEEFWGEKSMSKAERERSAESGLKFILAMLFCVASFLWIGFKLAYIYPLGVTEARPSEPGEAVQPIRDEKKEQLAVLILGSDKRENDAGRSDTIMVAFLDTEKKTIKIINIPRDTYVSVPSLRGKTKINHAFAYGGVSLTKETVEQFFDITIDYYVDTDFQGFARLIDALGGITVDVEKLMYYPAENIDLKQGTQLLNGEQALGYVRYRSDGMGDIGRVERQQKFLPILADRVFSLSTIWKIPKLINIFQENVETDFSLKDMLWLANKFKSTEMPEIETVMLPGEPDYINGVSYWITDPNQVADLVDQYSGKTLTETAEEQPEKEQN